MEDEDEEHIFQDLGIQTIIPTQVVSKVSNVSLIFDQGQYMLFDNQDQKWKSGFVNGFVVPEMSSAAVDSSFNKC